MSDEVRNIVLQHDVHLVGAAWLDGERLLASAKASHHRRDSLIGGAVDKHLLTSSLRHPKILIKEFSYFLMPYHQHGLRINLLV